MRRAIWLTVLVASSGCASKSQPKTAAAPPQPSISQRLFGGPPHPGDRLASRPDSDDYDPKYDKRDKDNDF
jgi:hypothetical protein